MINDKRLIKVSHYLGNKSMCSLQIPCAKKTDKVT